MRSDGKDNVETLSQVFDTYFTEESSHPKISKALGRNDPKNDAQVDFHDIKFFYSMHTRSWNRRVRHFLGCYFQRDDSFKMSHVCEVVIDDEHVVYHKNAVGKWEYESSADPDCSV